MYKQVKINSSKSVNSINKDSFIDIDIRQTNNTLPINDVSYIISQNTVYNNERQNSELYRINGTIIPTFTNALYNVRYDSNDINKMGIEYLFTSGFTDLRHIQMGIISDEESFKDNLLEQNGWFGYYEPDDPFIIESSPCYFNEFYPTYNHFDFLNDNWDVSIVYPFSSTTNNLINSGILLINGEDITLNNRDYILFTTPIKHNLQPGISVKLKGISSGLSDGLYNVVNIGDGDGYNTEYSFYITKPLNSGSFVLGNNARMIKIYQGEESVYYQRIGKKLDIKLKTYPMAFEKTIYNDDAVGFSTIEELNLSGLTDNLGRPISDVFIRFIKKETLLKKEDGTQDGYLFTKSIDGINIPKLMNKNHQILLCDYNIHMITQPSQSLSGYISYDANTTNIDIVEYNVLTQEEVILADIAHRFNTIERDDINDVNRPEGYYYIPHYRIPIREYSTYIEQGDKYTIGIPTYAVEFTPGHYLWRDLLEKGYSPNTDYPFLNGYHYIYKKIHLNLLRQDPYSEYGLYHGAFPRDPFGYKVFDDKYVVKRTADGCK